MFKQKHGRYKKDPTEPPEMETTRSEMKDTLDVINGRLDMGEENLSQDVTSSLQEIKGLEKYLNHSTRKQLDKYRI